MCMARSYFVRSVTVVLVGYLALLSGSARASTPYPRYIDGTAVTRNGGVVTRLKIHAIDRGGVGDEGLAEVRAGGGDTVALNLTCVNVLSATSGVAAATTSDGLTSYLIVVEDRGPRKDAFSVGESPLAESICSAGAAPPVPSPTKISRGDLLIRTGS